MTDRFRRALAMLWTSLQRLWYAVLWPLRVAYRDVGLAILAAMLWPFRQIWRGICAVGRFIRTAVMAVLHSPVGAYRAALRRRDWLLVKVEYLQAESNKFRTLFSIIKSPYTFLRACGLSPSLAATLLFGAGTVGGGVIVSETLLSERSFSRGDSGVYSAPSDIPTSYSDSDNTLRIDLHGSTPVGEITISDVTLGTAFTGSTLPSGESSVILIGGTATSSNFTETWLEVGHLVIDRWRCTNFEMSDVETHTLIIVGNSSDGQSLSPIPGTPRRRAIGGGNRADSMRTNGGTYDQLVLGAPTSGINGKVDKLTLSNLYTKGGLCKVSRIKADKIEVLLSEFGAGNGFASKEFIVKNSVIYKVAVIEDNVEVSISPP